MDKQSPENKVLILSVLKWAATYRLTRAGPYWGRDYSNIAYTDDKIVEDFLNGNQPVDKERMANT